MNNRFEVPDTVEDVVLLDFTDIERVFYNEAQDNGNIERREREEEGREGRRGKREGGRHDQYNANICDRSKKRYELLVADE